MTHIETQKKSEDVRRWTEWKYS